MPSQKVFLFPSRLGEAAKDEARVAQIFMYTFFLFYHAPQRQESQDYDIPTSILKLWSGFDLSWIAI